MVSIFLVTFILLSLLLLLFIIIIIIVLCVFTAVLGGLENMIKTENFDPQDLIKKSKKGKPVMIFVSVAGSPPDQAHTDRVSARWVQSLQNAHITVERYVVAPDRVLLLTQDGSKAWEIKDYLTTLSDCTTVSFDQLQFNCTTTYDKTEL